MSKIRTLNDQSYTPEVMAQDIDWKDVDTALIVSRGLDGRIRFSATAMTIEELALLKAFMDAVILGEIGGYADYAE